MCSSDLVTDWKGPFRTPLPNGRSYDSVIRVNSQSGKGAAANSAFGNMNSVAKQFADAAQSNIAAMTKKSK